MSDEKIDEVSGVSTTGHEWDGIRELNNPLPRWWVLTFYATIVWAVGYAVAYPAWPLINSATSGMLGYSSRADVQSELAAAEAGNRSMSRKSGQRASTKSWPTTICEPLQPLRARPPSRSIASSAMAPARRDRRASPILMTTTGCGAAMPNSCIRQLPMASGSLPTPIHATRRCRRSAKCLNRLRSRTSRTLLARLSGMEVDHDRGSGRRGSVCAKLRRLPRRQRQRQSRSWRAQSYRRHLSVCQRPRPTSSARSRPRSMASCPLGRADLAMSRPRNWQSMSIRSAVANREARKASEPVNWRYGHVVPMVDWRASLTSVNAHPTGARHKTAVCPATRPKATGNL